MIKLKLLEIWKATHVQGYPINPICLQREEDLIWTSLFGPFHFKLNFLADLYQHDEEEKRFRSCLVPCRWLGLRKDRTE